MHLLRWLTINLCHPRCAVMMTSTGLSVHLLVLSFNDLRGFPLRRQPSTVPYSMIFGSVSWRQTWPNNDSVWRSTADSKPVFRWVVGVLLHCLPTDQCRQQTASSKAVILRWTSTTVGCQFLQHLLLPHLQDSRSMMDAELSKLPALSFPEYIK